MEGKYCFLLKIRYNLNYYGGISDLQNKKKLGEMLLGSNLLTAEQLRRSGGFEKIIHHIADSHAKTNAFIDPKEVDNLAKSVKSTLERTAHNLKLSGFKITLASDFAQ